jgi:hypothetical protein
MFRKEVFEVVACFEPRLKNEAGSETQELEAHRLEYGVEIFVS